ncbi:FAD-dependent oxidoreductase [Devosia sp.]|uniref:FAD-dependent oxidoreductase n=1 Tax=Devosia sp. TaxID=1871048 RepID=UPI002F0A646B
MSNLAAPSAPAAAPATDEICDVLVVGSGSAGLVAALCTAAAGLSTLVVERAQEVGGTTAISAAGTWIPANHHAAAAGLTDSPEAAFAYIRNVAPESWRDSEEALWQRFVREAPQMLAFLERTTPLRFALTNQPDAYPDVSGGVIRGRMLSPRVLRKRLAGPLARRLRRPTLPHVFTYQEALSLDPHHHPLRAGLLALPRLVWRWLIGARGMGTALVVGLLKGCLDHGCRFELGARAVAPILIDGSVHGLFVEQHGRIRGIYARRGVVLASGGFEWDAERLDRHFPGPRDFVASPPGNDGDAHRIASAAGARLAHMDQANITAGMPFRAGAHPFGISHSFHQEANAIAVDRNGRRFVNEYRFNIGEVLDTRDPATGLPLHLPAWIISDADFLRRSPIVRRIAARNPGWMVKAPTLAELAALIDVPDAALLATVERFNGFCASQVDADFHRERVGARAISIGGRRTQRLQAITRPPFIAMPFNRTVVSTKGGPRTDAAGRVLRPDGSVIDGLYCAGVAMANPIGTWAVGAGTTIGPNMTWGYVCGQSLLAAPDRADPGRREGRAG